MMSVAPAGAGDGGGANRRAPYKGFWMWQAEMQRLDLWPRMDQAFEGRALEGSANGNAQPMAAELEEARQAWLRQGGKQ